MHAAKIEVKEAPKTPRLEEETASGQHVYPDGATRERRLAGAKVGGLGCHPEACCYQLGLPVSVVTPSYGFLHHRQEHRRCG
jgi:hypothetical protein